MQAISFDSERGPRNSVTLIIPCFFSLPVAGVTWHDVKSVLKTEVKKYQYDSCCHCRVCVMAGSAAVSARMYVYLLVQSVNFLKVSHFVFVVLKLLRSL